MDFTKINEIITLMNLLINGESLNEDKNTIIARECLSFIQQKLDCLEEVEIDNNNNNSEECDENYLLNENYFHSIDNTYDYQNVIKISEYIKTHPAHNFKTVKRKYRKLSYSTFYKIKKFVNNNNNIGFEKSKIQIIKGKLFQKFKEFREKHFKVSQKCLKLWAIQFAKDINYPNFKAGNLFLHNFKKQYRICGRRINKFVTRKSVQKEEDLQTVINKFRHNFQENISPNFQQEHILNADQTNFKYEMSPKRTLALKGEKLIKIKIQNKNSITHSYTLMPTISMSGKCFGLSIFILILNA